MKIVIASLMALMAAGVGVPAFTQNRATNEQQAKKQNRKSDPDKLYALVKRARADLREMRIKAGLHAHPAGPHIDPEGHHANDSEAQRKRERGEKSGHEEGNHEAGGDRGHGERRGERKGREGRGEHGRGERRGREGRGEHGSRREGRGEHGGRREGRGERGGREERERRRGRGEEGKTRFAKNAKHDHVYRNGARLVLEFNPNTEAFVGKVTNTTRKTLSQVRVEIHLSNGVELGPTKRIDVKPGKTIPVELSAFGQKFTHWVTHPEAGVEAGHGPGGEESEGHAAREKGEHGTGRGDGGGGEHGREGGEKDSQRPGAAFRPVYNQIMLLRGEMKAFKADVAAKNKKKKK